MDETEELSIRIFEFAMIRPWFQHNLSTLLWALDSLLVPLGELLPHQASHRIQWRALKLTAVMELWVSLAFCLST
jgi:hypothetical protein